MFDDCVKSNRKFVDFCICYNIMIVISFSLVIFLKR